MKVNQSNSSVTRLCVTVTLNLLFLFFAGITWAADICVSDQAGTDANGDPVENGKFKDAVDAASEGDTIHFGDCSGGCPANCTPLTYVIKETPSYEGHGITYDGHGSTIQLAGKSYWPPDPATGLPDVVWPPPVGSGFRSLRGLEINGPQTLTPTIIKGFVFDGNASDQGCPLDSDGDYDCGYNSGVSDDEPKHRLLAIRADESSSGDTQQSVLIQDSTFESSIWGGLALFKNINATVDGGSSCPAVYGVTTSGNHHGITILDDNVTAQLNCVKGADAGNSLKVEKNIPTKPIKLYVNKSHFEKPSNTQIPLLAALAWGVGPLDGHELHIDDSALSRVFISGGVQVSIVDSVLGIPCEGSQVYAALRVAPQDVYGFVVDNTTIHGFVDINAPSISHHVMTFSNTTFVSPKDPPPGPGDPEYDNNIIEGQSLAIRGYAIKLWVESLPSSSASILEGRHIMLDNVTFNAHPVTGENYPHILQLWGGSAHVKGLKWENHGTGGTNTYTQVIRGVVGTSGGLPVKSSIWVGDGDCLGDSFASSSAWWPSTSCSSPLPAAFTCPP